MAPMKAIRRIAIVFLLTLTLAACGGYEEDIEAVQRASIGDQTNQDFVEDIAGARGTYEWTAGPYRKGQEEIILVTATIEKTDSAGEVHEIRIDWLRNRQTNKVAQEALFIDGERRGLLSGALDLFLMELK